MIKMIQKPKGTLDILPEETVLWHFAENIMREKARLFGFEEIRFPTFELTSLFKRGVRRNDGHRAEGNVHPLRP